MSFQNPDSGMWVCKKHEWESPSECVECLIEENEQMQPVYDAAMTWFELHDQPGSEKESEAWIAFRQACRRAKEGK